MTDQRSGGRECAHLFAQEPLRQHDRSTGFQAVED
jgi:hypothetical protein